MVNYVLILKKYIDIVIKLSVVLTFYITVKFLSTATHMKRKKRSRSIKNKNINASKDYSNKHVMNDHADKISFLTQKPITKKEEEEEEKGKTTTENFDTSQYEPITEMKESIAMSISIQEQDEDKKKTISNAQKEGLINPEMVINAIPSGSSDNNNNNAYANFPDTTPAITKEPPPNITEPKQAKEKGEAESGPKEYKNIKNLEDHRNENSNSYMNGMALWQRTAIAWINTYNEIVGNAVKMNECWFNLLSMRWTREQKNASGEKIRVE